MSIGIFACLLMAAAASATVRADESKVTRLASGFGGSAARSSGSKHIRLRVRMITDSSGANTIMIFVSSITGRSLMTSTQAQRLLPLAGKPVGQLLVHE